jgi:hypothetical protein
MNQQNLNFRTTPLIDDMKKSGVLLEYTPSRLAKLREAMGVAIGNGDTTTAISLLSMMRRVSR